MRYKEKAFLLNNCLGLHKLSDFERIYLGDEFCENLLPSLSLMEDILSWCAQYHHECTLVTAYLTNKSIDRINKLIEFILKRKIRLEIVMNDWSILKLLLPYHVDFEVILGRILVSHYLSKFHFYESLRQGNPNKEELRLYCLFPDTFLSFLKENNISRLEFNVYSHLMVTKEQLQSWGFKSHLYFPYAYLTTSRFCSCAGGYHSYIHNASDICNKKCEKSIASIKNKNFNKKIWIKGNTYFIYQGKDVIVPNYEPDRIIYNDFLVL